MLTKSSLIHDLARSSWRLLVFATIAGNLFGVTLTSQSVRVTKPAPTGSPSHYSASRFPGHAAAYYAAIWGVDSLSVKAVESGELLRFTYRILDPSKAKVLNNKSVNAFLIAPDAGLRLSVPSLEKVGQLRQSSTPEAGRSYWMAFSNPGRRVKRGERVDVVIGEFKAEGLVVD